jgi:hypothetical protein
VRLSIEHQSDMTVVAVYDNDRMVASAKGTSAQEAARWLLQQVERIATQTRALLSDAGLDPNERPKSG